MNILVIEDDKDCLHFIQEALGPLAHNFIPALTLAEGLELVEANPQLDAVWLDLNLTDSVADKTMAVIPSLRRKLTNAALIVVSGYGDFYRSKCLDAGADAYASKKELCGFNQQCIAALFVTAAITSMKRGVNANKILERVSSFFASLSTTATLDAT